VRGCPETRYVSGDNVKLNNGNTGKLGEKIKSQSEAA